jgi:hypothetical protein
MAMGLDECSSDNKDDVLNFMSTFFVAVFKDIMAIGNQGKTLKLGQDYPILVVCQSS